MLAADAPMDSPQFLAWVCSAHWPDEQARHFWEQGPRRHELSAQAPACLAQAAGLVALARAGLQIVNADTAWAMLQRAHAQLQPASHPGLYTRLILEMVRLARLSRVDELPEYMRALVEQVPDGPEKAAELLAQSWHVLRADGHFAQAQAVAEQAQHAFHAVGAYDREHVCVLMRVLNEKDLERPQDSARLALIEYARELARQHGLATKELHTMTQLVAFYGGATQYERACQVADQAQREFTGRVDRNARAWLHLMYIHGDALQHLRRDEQAHQKIELAFQGLLDGRYYQAAVWYMVDAAEVCAQLGLTARAHDLMSRAMDTDELRQRGAADLQVDKLVRQHELGLEMQRQKLAENTNARLQEEVERRTAGLHEQVARRRQAQERALRASIECPQTGLGNRGALIAMLSSRENHRDAPLTLMLVALEGHQLVSHVWGLTAADRLMVEVADALRRAAERALDLYRVGADLFALYFEGTLTDAELLPLSAAVQNELRELKVDEQHFRLGAQLGVCQFPKDGARAEDLLHAADLAALQAGNHPPYHVSRFHPGLHTLAAQRLDLASQFDAAMANGQLCFHYQMQFDTRSGLVHSLEALARWNHPTLQLLAPRDFIDHAEQGLTQYTFGRWALRRALADRLSLQGLVVPSCRVAVNITPAHFCATDFVAQVATELHVAGCPALWLELELTERRPLADMAQARQNMLALQDMGVVLSLDDFGTGYNSITGMCTLPFDVLKIDRIFVDGTGTDEKTNGVVTAMLGLAHARGMKVVAEGVEEAVQLAWLRQAGVHVAQGYYLHRPESMQGLVHRLIETAGEPPTLPGGL